MLAGAFRPVSAQLKALAAGNAPPEGDRNKGAKGTSGTSRVDPLHMEETFGPPSPSIEPGASELRGCFPTAFTCARRVFRGLAAGFGGTRRAVRRDSHAGSQVPERVLGFRSAALYPRSANFQPLPGTPPGRASAPDARPGGASGEATGRDARPSGIFFNPSKGHGHAPQADVYAPGPDPGDGGGPVLRLSSHGRTFGVDDSGSTFHVGRRWLHPGPLARTVHPAARLLPPADGPLELASPVVRVGGIPFLV